MKKGRPRSIRRKKGTKTGVKRSNPKQRAAIRMRGYARKRKGR